MTLSYDKSADVLYVTFEKAEPGTYVYTENQNGDILRLDRESGRVVGVTIPFFAKRSKVGKIVIPEVGAVPFNNAADLIFQ
jgi:uncharacterized protein YuzE